ncbi:MAG: hypothetical protein L0228_11190, partial [Planctomycetes bacterium]|nr:hypothetical protein [Planctomycetota bacterium]
MPRPRLHKSSIVLGLVAAALLVLLNIPGRVIDYQPSFRKTFEHGWPYIYLRRETREPTKWTTYQGMTLTLSYTPVILGRRDIASYLPTWGIPWLSAENWQFWEAHIEEGIPRWDFRGATLVLDCVVVLLVLLAVIAAWEIRRRRRPRLLCFGLSDLMVAVSGASLLLGYLVYLNREYQREAQIDAEKLVSIDDSWFAYEDECIAPVWVRSLIGERFLPNFLWRHDNVLIDPELVIGENMAHPKKSATQQRKKMPRISEGLLDIRVSLLWV